MKFNRHQQGRRGSLSGLLLVFLLVVSAVLAVSAFRAAPNESQATANPNRIPTVGPLPPPPNATTITVINTNDSGPGSLRQAIADAQDGDTIQFAQSLNGQTILLTTAQLVIDKNLTITGPGVGLLAVARDQAQSAQFRIFSISSGHTVAMSGFAINGGKLADQSGAGINNSGTLTLTNCSFNANNTNAWNGVFAGGGAIYNNGTLNLINSAVVGNSAIGGWSYGGGGISNAGVMTISQTTIGSNQGDIRGGGIFNSSGMLTISGSTISNNHTMGIGHGNGDGGGILNLGTLILENSTVRNNSASGDGTGGNGGGIANNGSLQVTYSTINNNTSIRGAGISGWGQVTNSTITGNTAQFDGGGLYGSGTVSNSTISGNSTGSSGGAIRGGGAITNSTISGNNANPQTGGSIYASTAVHLKNSVLKAGNGATIVNNSSVISDGYNLSSDNGGGFLTGPGDQINIDPMLGPLQNNGGPTSTHALLPGSLAIDTGDPNFTPPPLYDQRGLGHVRVYNGRIDIGSFEVQPTPTPSPTATGTVPPSPTPVCPSVITQSTSETITAGNSISCNNGIGHADNSYWRAFNLLVPSPLYLIVSVSFGVESVNQPQTVIIRLYLNNGGPFPAGTRTQIYETGVNVTSAQSGTVVTQGAWVTFDGSETSRELVMELFTPDGLAAGNLFFVGSNTDVQTGPSYFSAPACGITTPTDLATLGFPNMHVVFRIGGLCFYPTPTPSPPSPTPTPTPGPATHFAVVAPSWVQTFLPFNFTVTALDAANHTATGYTGTIHFTSSSGAGGTSLPPNSTLSNGVGTFSAVISEVGNFTITATDTVNSSITGTSNNIQVVSDIPSPTATATGSPTPTPSPSLTVSPTPSPAQSLNLSSRLLVLTGEEVGIGGFIITGTAPKFVIIRGLGPSLANQGVPNALADPTLELHGQAGTLELYNDNWHDPPPNCDLFALGLAPTNDLESVICATLDPGPYTAILRGNNNGTGVALLEIYDLGPDTSKLANLSTRAYVGTDSNVLIGGFILGGGTNPTDIVLRGLGPSLAASGVTNYLADPVLELHDGNGGLLTSNDNCAPGSSLPPPDPLEACVETSLSPGIYTTILAGADGGTGVGLLEIYNLH